MVDELLPALTRLRAFAKLPAEAVQASSPLWKVVRLGRDKLLWKQGRVAEALAFVHTGGLDVLVHGTPIATVHAGEMIGEMSLFPAGARRLASLSAREPTVVLSLTAANFKALRDQQSPVFLALLDHALLTAARRVQQIDQQLVQFNQGNFAPPPEPEDSLISRLWQRVRPPPPPDPSSCPPIGDLLARHPVLGAIDTDTRKTLAQAFTATSFRRGTTLARENETDTRTFLLAAGTVDVLRTVEAHGAAILISRFEPGASFGALAAFLDEPRRETIAATSDGWVYSIDRPAVDALPAPARQAWKEAALTVLARQCQTANDALLTNVGAFRDQDTSAMPSMAMTVDQAKLANIRLTDLADRHHDPRHTKRRK